MLYLLCRIVYRWTASLVLRGCWSIHTRFTLRLLQVNPELEQQVQEAMMQKIDQKLAESEGAGGGASHGANPPATPAPGDEPARNGSLVSSPSGVSDMEKKGLLDVGTPQSQPSSTPGGVAAATTTAVAVAQDPEAGDVAVTMMPR